MPEVFYWGEGGQYGPYAAQEDGWPNAGEVMRDYRERKGLKAEEFACMYSEELKKLGKQNKKGKQGQQGKVTGNWILNMEKQNIVPTDISRRRIIARLLGIPPVLLGLASLEHVVMQPQNEATAMTKARPTALQKISMDITPYRRNVQVALHLHRTSQAQDLLNDINADLRDLEGLVSQAQGDFLYHVGELLIGNDLLATKIAKDQGRFSHAYAYANAAVRMTKRLKDDELLAAAKYTRGCVKLEWGLASLLLHGRLHIDTEKVVSALSDFQAILDLATSRQGLIHPQLHGFTLLQLSRAQSALKHNIPNALLLADQASELIGREAIDEPFTRLLVTGTLSGLHKGGYHLVKAGILNAAGLPGKAISELNTLKQLTEQTYRQDETRNQVWIDITLAEALMGVEEYGEATYKARGALITCHAINSVQNVATLVAIYSRLLTSSYKTAAEVKELGDMLREWYGVEQEKLLEFVNGR
jgi:hypothetical protein